MCFCQIMHFVHLDGFMHSGLGNEVGREILWENYYQWVSIVLCVQAAMFYLPYFLWKHWEGGKLALLVKDLGKAYYVTSSKI